MKNIKKTVFICGRYGSGKTTVSLNLAFMLSNAGNSVSLVDLDIVNPYFRSSDLRELINRHGVKLYASKPNDVTIIDEELLPDVIKEINETDSFVVSDVGADEEGFEAMHHISSKISLSECDVLYVVNFNKLSTSSVEAAYKDIILISEEMGIKCTGIINNTQVGGTADQIMLEDSAIKAEELAEKSGIPLVYNCYNKSLDLFLKEKVLPIEIYVTPSWVK